jgi:hypothetical protein
VLRKGLTGTKNLLICCWCVGMHLKLPKEQRAVELAKQPEFAGRSAGSI